MNQHLSEYINTELDKLHQLNNYRFLRNAPSYFINVSSNDYLGLSKRLDLQTEFLHQIQKEQNFILSAASSRLLSGNHREYDKLETEMSKLFGKSCLTFNSGYHANIGILPTLVQQGDLIVSDKFNHASIIDGIRLTKGVVETFRHLDYNHLEQILKDNSEKYKNIFVVTESVFSMDGDEANLLNLIALKQKYGFYLYLDEAHAFGIRGNSGLGCADELNVIDQIDFIVGTFGKAIASAGAYVICNEKVRDFLINKSRSIIFTTALPPINIAWTFFIVQQLKNFTAERYQLQSNSLLFSEKCKEYHLEIFSQTHIFPFIIGSNEQAIQFSNCLKDVKINALPVRYPTVPEGTARIRFSITAGLSVADIVKVVDETARIYTANLMLENRTY